ncbi:MAG TPA: MG2 domain-containing protein [Kofleriaceae bacterium]
MSKKLWIAATVVLGAMAVFDAGEYSAWAMFRYGITAEDSPDAGVRQSAELLVQNARRGAAASGTITLEPHAHYTVAGSNAERDGRVVAVQAIEAWITPKPGRTGVVEKARSWPLDVDWHHERDGHRGVLALPELADGDYLVHVRYRSALGTDEVAAPLALYTPARIHVITDRPLYQPGNTVRFRAVALRARDLTPLDGRPGTWTISDPDGEVLLEETAPAGDWGVVAGSFPLDRAARPGTWKVAWRSDAAVDEVAFTVQPFTLPRFRVDTIAGAPFYRPGDAPRIKGAVIYSSGAPVAGATLDIQWNVAGAWPAPAEWQGTGPGALPRQVRTSAAGQFELALPPVPAYLQGAVSLQAQISAVDAAGDRVAGAASVLLSQDGIAASAVTELGDGLVSGFNNRLYLRVTTPDGRVLAGKKIKVARAWQPGAPVVEAELDDDGVASLQLDPGAPVNIIVPAAPWRPAPRRALVSRGEPRELIGNRGASLGDQVELDRWLAPLAACAPLVTGDTDELKLGLRVGAAGNVIAAMAGPSGLGRCAAEVIRRQHLPASGERLYALELHFADPELPNLIASLDTTLDAPAELAGRLTELARTARDCLPLAEGKLASLLSWQTRAGSKDVSFTGWLADDTAADGKAAQACAAARFARAGKLVLNQPATSDGMGVVRFAVSLPASVEQHRPQPTTMLGYELAIAADLDGAPSTKLRIAPGTVPELRMRVTPVLAKPGETITAELLRGPKFTGVLPAKLHFECLAQRADVALGADRKAQLALGDKATGWCSVEGGGARAVVYVQARTELAVQVTPGQDRYRPGDRAELAIHTSIGGVGSKAAVGLFGVDDSLGQLAPLPGADALGRILPKVESAAPAFGVLDGQALALGRIRGANAAAAAVTRVQAIPRAAELDAVATGIGRSAFDPIAELTDRFYLVLAELHAQAHAWETKAPAGAKMTLATMAGLWQAALAACEARGLGVDDAYGRRLRLGRLPGDLLALTDPRAVIVDATRLPEDIENWPAWVGKENP